ncbi:MAG: hypothetical protein HKO01_08920 [Flaviramulus sp.]|nr:hypothetical protein [Flaviramulus sp.]NNC50641.1 hypothetical protein [Flaviramulus sp.]
MKNIIYISALLLFTGAIAQEANKEAKEETEVKIVKIKNGNKTTEKKVKVITRETGSVELAEADENKVNQDRVESVSKVEKMVMVDDDGDEDYDYITKETYYKIGDKEFLFKPNNRGFDIAFNNNEEKFVKKATALNTNASGHYIVNGEAFSGIGYFNRNGDFVIEYYNKENDTLEIKTYILAETAD